MEGRYILSNIIKLMELMNQCDRQCIQALVMALDYEKCFDSIEHHAIVGSMRYFGIGSYFQKAVMVLFAKFELCTTNNGYASAWFAPTRGCHQGCNISPHIFLLVG